MSVSKYRRYRYSENRRVGMLIVLDSEEEEEEEVPVNPALYHVDTTLFCNAGKNHKEPSAVSLFGLPLANHVTVQYCSHYRSCRHSHCSLKSYARL